MLKKMSILLLIAILSISIIAGCAGSGGDDNGNDRSDEQTDIDESTEIASPIDIKLSEFKITPSNITIQKGETINFKVENDGSTFHTYTIEGLDEELRLQSGQSDNVEIKFDKPGTYKVLCTVPNHEDRGMVGEIKVED